jgi:hypothetical protein
MIAMQMPSTVIINTLSNAYIRCPADLEVLTPVPELSALELEDEAEEEEEEEEEEDGGTALLEDEELPGSFDVCGSKITPDDGSNRTTTACVSRTNTENVPSDETVVKVVSLVAPAVGRPSSV